MICLDANYLIGGLITDSQEALELAGWVAAGELLIASMPAWYEFLCGPVTPPQVAAMRNLLHEIVPFGDDEAREAARLFNAVGRIRSLRVDAMIAATAIVADAPLATQNRGDFARFLPHGLRLT